jgi:hypothetical protein
VPRKVRTNKRRVGANVTPMQERWLSGEWLLGSEPRTPDETMEALSLMSNGLGKNSALWSAHGDQEKFFWRPGMRLPISLSDLEHSEACWLEAGATDADNFGGDSPFIWQHYSEAEKVILWETWGDKEHFRWEPVLRRPIPRGASVDAAMVAFTTMGPFNIA